MFFWGFQNTLEHDSRVCCIFGSEDYKYTIQAFVVYIGSKDYKYSLGH